jgi:hypothetical protein
MNEACDQSHGLVIKTVAQAAPIRVAPRAVGLLTLMAYIDIHILLDAQLGAYYDPRLLHDY